MTKIPNNILYITRIYNSDTREKILMLLCAIDVDAINVDSVFKINTVVIFWR